MGATRRVSAPSRSRKLNEGKALEGGPPLPWEGFRRPTVGRLDTAGRIRRELVRLYKDARLGELDAGNASKLGNLLFLALRALEAERAIEPRPLPEIRIVVEEPCEGYYSPDCQPPEDA